MGARKPPVGRTGTMDVKAPEWLKLQAFKAVFDPAIWWGEVDIAFVADHLPNAASPGCTQGGNVQPNCAAHFATVEEQLKNLGSVILHWPYLDRSFKTNWPGFDQSHERFLRAWWDSDPDPAKRTLDIEMLEEVRQAFLNDFDLLAWMKRTKQRVFQQPSPWPPRLLLQGSYGRDCSVPAPAWLSDFAVEKLTPLHEFWKGVRWDSEYGQYWKPDATLPPVGTVERDRFDEIGIQTGNLSVIMLLWPLVEESLQKSLAPQFAIAYGKFFEQWEKSDTGLFERHIGEFKFFAQKFGDINPYNAALFPEIYG